MVVKKNMKFSEEKVAQWQTIWSQICDMAYLRENITDKIIVYPESELAKAHYNNNRCQNADELTLDYTWEIYSRKYPVVHVVPEFKELYIPAALFESLGITQWFKHSFPNCVVTFW
jgi:hypothetical protein